MKTTDSALSDLYWRLRNTAIYGHPDVYVGKIGPRPHYPNWRYMCPFGPHFWDAADHQDDDLRTCPEHKATEAYSVVSREGE